MGSLVEFQKLPYNPASPLPQRTPLMTAVRVVKIISRLLIYLVKLVPHSLYLLLRRFRCKSPKDIRGWTALVTGGANGLGRAIAIELAKHGCHVVVADLDEYAATRTVLELQYYGVKAVAYKIDVACNDQVSALRQRIETDFGSPVDLLVNNAGIVPFLVSDEYMPDNLQRLMNVNILANFYTVNAFLPGMYARQRGHIVTIASAAAYLPVGLMRHYTTSKYAMRGFMEELRDEIRLAGQWRGVKTTTIYPFQLNTRKELVEAVLKMPFFSQLPVIDSAVAASSIVHSIRANKRQAFAPDWFSVGWAVALIDLLPRRFKYLFLEDVLRN